MGLKEYFEDIATKVNSVMLSFLQGNIQELYGASRYLIEAGGKRLRPIMVVLAADILGGDQTRALLAGAAVEVLHNFTLIHDDIMDQDALRRGLPTVHVKWGVPTAILAGDLLHAKAFEILTESVKGLDSDRIYKAFSCFSKSVIIVSEGQAMDMDFEKRWDVKEEEYIEMIRKKTAQLFACSAYLGGLVAGGSEENLRNLYEYGENIGIAFQIVDDILGLTADEKELGKPVFSDIREGKKTILVIRALEVANKKEREVILEGLGSNDPVKIKETAQVLSSISLTYAQSLASHYYNKALSALNSVEAKNTKALEGLKEIADLVIKRRK
ncbi:polyprenyl synthetase family protein [Metallosphaera tengchongensis]|uniref:Polyprenyl synthetase family protein n=1 Tax=Metallosphaera tengchongensis TaxID=1532350 RepID=A0A6N0NV56_9CREN|nr:geranylgeranyl diphosphate synthase [Metallosphaera tengchongensis]QKQ99722.1 polyprenyl synthetase family protein [Metallosphaera tengchongensis]